MSHFVLANQEASINVFFSAEWMPEVTLPLPLDSNQSISVIKVIVILTMFSMWAVKLVNLQDIKFILCLNYLHLYRFLLFYVEKYFNRNLFG